MNIPKNLISIGLIAAIFVLPSGLFFTMGGMVNSSSSIPPGLYWAVDKPIAKDRYIAFCPPNRPEFKQALDSGLIGSGNCPEKFGKILVKVAAKARDVVTINSQGITVNDNLLPQSQPRAEIPVSSVTKLERYPLKPNEIVVISETKDAPFDSRYFGLLDVNQIDSVVEPIIQW